MKQAANAELPAVDPDAEGGGKITAEERVKVLTSQSSKDAVPDMKKPDKMSMMNKLRIHRNDFLAAAQSFDDQKGNSNLRGYFVDGIPSARRGYKDLSNEALAAKIVSFYDQFSILRTFLLQLKEESISYADRLRSSSVARRNEEKDEDENPVLEIVMKYFDMMDKVDKIVRNNRVGDNNQNEVIKKVTLTAAQKERFFDKERFPSQAYLQTCLACGHKFTNLPIENDQVAANNIRIEKKYQADLKEWDAEQKAIADGTSQAKSRRKPKRPALKKVIVQCMCANARCMMENSDCDMKCPIRCRKDNGKGDRYPYSSEYPRHCTCPLCLCKCEAAFYVEDVKKGFLAKNRKMPEGLEKFCEQQDSSTSSATGIAGGFAMISSELQTGLLTGFGNLGSLLKSGKSFVDLTDEEKKGLAEYSKNLILNQTAEGIAKNANTTLSNSDKVALREVIGKPKRVVELPSGQMFSTNSLAQSNQHAHNNRFGDIAAGNNDFPSPGMVDTFTPDFSETTLKYQQAVWNYYHGGPKPDVASVENEEKKIADLLTSPPTVPTPAASVPVPAGLVPVPAPPMPASLPATLLVTPSRPKNDSKMSSKDIAVSEMGERVIKKAKTNVTSAVIERVDCGDKSEKSKKKLRRANSVHARLLRSKKDGNFIDEILLMTDDGDMLMEEPKVMSQEVLERLDDYYNVVDENDDDN